MTDAAASFVFKSRFGTQVLGPNRTRFRLWAPTAGNVTLELDGGPNLPMSAVDDGFFELEVNTGPGTLYYYRVSKHVADPGIRVPDPAARAQLGDIDGPSQVIDPAAFVWKHAQWPGRPWTETILYELHPGLLGGFEGVRKHLQYLVELGVTAIELMPVAEFPGGRNWGYDGALLYAVEASYGGPEQLKALIDEAHGCGLMVFLDVVYNHFGPAGNYLAAYAGPFFREDIITPWGAAIDFRQPQVRQFFIDNALLWLLEYQFDGLRFDAVHAISERDFLVEMAEEVRRNIPPGRQVHLVLENERNAATLLDEAHYTAQWNDDAHNVLHVLLTGEQEGYYSDFVEQPTEKLLRCLREGFIYQGQRSRHGHGRGEPSGGLPPYAFVLFLQNHDQTGNRALGERLLSIAEPDAVFAATVLQLLSPMVPLLFMGEEWGSERPFLYFTEHHAELADAVREGRRGEFADFAAFKDEAQRERIPDPNAVDTFNASVPDFDARERSPHREWLQRYKDLLRLRQREIIPRLAGSHTLAAEALGEGAVLARWRLGDGAELAIALNLGADAVALGAADPDYAWRCLYESRDDARLAAAQGRLPGRTALAWLGLEPLRGAADD